jgi:2-iminobutanoate/2-iminopropanoate deaminase
MPKRKAIQPDDVAVPKVPYSPVVVSEDLVYTAGQAPFDKDGKLVSDDVAEQTRQVLTNLRACLAAAGCGLEDVLKVNAYLTSLDDFPAYNEVYAEFFKAPYPARTTVQAGLVGFKVEIEAVARKPS